MTARAILMVATATALAGVVHVATAHLVDGPDWRLVIAAAGSAQIATASGLLMGLRRAHAAVLVANGSLLLLSGAVHLGDGTGPVWLIAVESAIWVVEGVAALAIITIAIRTHLAPGRAARPMRELAAPGGDLSRRRLIASGSMTIAGALAMSVAPGIGGTRAADRPGSPRTPPGRGDAEDHHADEHVGMTVGEVDHARNGFDPSEMVDDWDLGTVSVLPSGQTLRQYVLVAQDTTIEVAPGVFFESWNYNGRIPGPTIRCQEGDRIRIEFINGGSHPHTIHFHGIHSAAMDGVPGQGAGNIAPGDRTVYEFDAYPFGCHLYHCHTSPLVRHIHKGLYGAFIVDPDPARHPDLIDLATRRTLVGAREQGIRELLIVMNGFDTNFDGENEVYAANTVAFHYARHPIQIRTDEDIRMYLINLTEFDPINSLHLHANFFDYYDHGTTLEPTLSTIDTVMQCQAQRGILEFSYRGHEPGRYMFHAHQSEFVELGWMSFLEVVPAD